jgi:tRNA A37 methylthiotransferase MiaB
VLIYIKEKALFCKSYYIRVCWGCVDNHCTYCSIWRAVGRLRSKPLEICLAEFRAALKKGYKKIILVGENVGAYGIDINSTLSQLLSAFVSLDGQYEIQLECLNAVWIIKYIDELATIMRTGRIKIVDCTIQSGSSRILKLMNRNYDRDLLRESLRRLREAWPSLRLHTHIMVGFPSETEQELEETLSIIKEFKFSLVQVFPFTQNDNLPREYLQWLIPPDFIMARMEKTAKFLRRHRIAYLFD